MLAQLFILIKITAFYNTLLQPKRAKEKKGLANFSFGTNMTNIYFMRA